jgi:sortase A
MRGQRIKTKVMTLLVHALVLVGLWQGGSGGWIYMKAQLAQVLLQRAWAGTLAGQQAVKPWPWADTWPIARLIVPGLGIDQIVLEGAYGRTLAFGPAHLESASYANEGTVILTGHRDTHFAFLERVQTGERFILQSSNGHIRSYRVSDRRIVDSRSGRIPLDRGHPALVLVTCYPFHTAMSGGPLRLVVTGEAEDTELDRRVRTVGTSGG